MKKLDKSKFPDGHSPTDFQCFGPAATKDGAFTGTMLCDMGCFAQGEVDSNKYYHAAVVQSRKNSKWYTYVEFGRVGVTNPQYQFQECSSKEEALQAYEAQLHLKNDKRGEWVKHPVLGNILQPKANKDCYLVRPQTTRSTGLPDARTITTVRENKQEKKVQGGSGNSNFDCAALSLLKDLNLGTVSYTRSSMVNDAIPTQEAIEEARNICSEIQKVINKYGDATPHREVQDYTKLLYSRIPKKKDRSETDWALNANKVQVWLQDLDAYEQALVAYNSSSVIEVKNDYGFHLKHLPISDGIYGFIKDFFMNGTRNVHSYIKKVNIVNVFEVERQRHVLIGEASQIKRTSREIPLHQPKKRVDIDENHSKIYEQSGTWMLFHGTRSVNVGGILRESLRMPKTLSNVATNGAMFGSGIYFADDRNKSIGYTSYSGSIWSGGGGGINSRGAFIFICDVALGNPYVATGSKAFAGPPSGYHSVFGKSGMSGVQNNEFIVFNPKALNLRYLVEFK